MADAYKKVSYDSESSCRFVFEKSGRKISFERHNYKPSAWGKLQCVDCGHKLELSQDDLETSAMSEKLSKLKLIEMDKNKKVRPKYDSDYTIYKISLSKEVLDLLHSVISDALISKLEAMFSTVDELNYIGKTFKHAEKRFIRGHLDKAFSGGGSSDFHDFIREYFPDRDLANELFSIEVLQVLDYELYLDQIIQAADNAERYWIGYFHSQFREYGFNTAPGGAHFGESFSLPDIDFKTFDSLIRESVHISLSDGPLDWISERLPNGGSTRWIQEACYDIYGESYSDIRKEYIEDELLPLIKEGWRGHAITEMFGLKTRNDEGSIAPSGTYRVTQWCKELFDDDTMTISKARRLFLPAIIKQLIRKGFLTYKDIADQLPGATERTIEKYCFDELGAGQKELKIKIYQRYKANNLLRSNWSQMILQYQNCH